jgi:hypothetical protein
MTAPPKKLPKCWVPHNLELFQKTKKKYLITGFEIHFCNKRRLTGGDLYKCIEKPLNFDGTAVGFNYLLVAHEQI